MVFPNLEKVPTFSRFFCGRRPLLFWISYFPYSNIFMCSVFAPHERLWLPCGFHIVERNSVWHRAANMNYIFQCLRKGVPYHSFPKSRHCMHWGPSKVIIYLPTKVFLIPQKRSFNYIYLTFSLSNMIYSLLSKKCCELHLHTCMGQIAQDAWMLGCGGQPNLGNACILGTFGHATPPLLRALALRWKYICENVYVCIFRDLDLSFFCSFHPRNRLLQWWMIFVAKIRSKTMVWMFWIVNNVNV